jgi:hypothetical protein
MMPLVPPASVVAAVAAVLGVIVPLVTSNPITHPFASVLLQDAGAPKLNTLKKR